MYDAWRHLVNCDLVFKEAKVDELFILCIFLLFKVLFIFLFRILRRRGLHHFILIAHIILLLIIFVIIVVNGLDNLFILLILLLLLISFSI